MTIALLTPTGCRPEAWKLCERWISRQTYQDWLWIIQDDGEEKQEYTLGDRQIILRPDEGQYWQEGQDTSKNNLLSCCRRLVTIDRQLPGNISHVFIIEDDEWYSKNYLEVMMDWFLRGSWEILGEGFARYYSLRTRTWRQHNNYKHACLCRTAFSFNRLSDFMEVLEEEGLVDINFWKRYGEKYGKIFSTDQPLSVGIKGMPGRDGLGAGHNGHSAYKPDPNLSLLQGWLGKDVKLYEPYIGSEVVNMALKENRPLNSTVIVYVGAGHQQAWMQAVIKGFNVHGIKATAIPVNQPIQCQLAVLWGIRRTAIIDYQKRLGNHALILERGYFKDRFKYASFGLDGLNGLGRYNNDKMPNDRWAKFEMELKEWRTGGDHIVLAGQVAGDMSCKDINLTQWLSSQVQEIRQVTNMPIVFKPHPLSRVDSKPRGLGLGIVHDLDNAACVIGYSSNLLVDAVIEGIPVVAHSPISMAWPVAGRKFTGIENLIRPDRSQWAWNLAYAQWSLAEISAGKAWGHLQEIF